MPPRGRLTWHLGCSWSSEQHAGCMGCTCARRPSAHSEAAAVCSARAVALDLQWHSHALRIATTQPHPYHQGQGASAASGWSGQAPSRRPSLPSSWDHMGQYHTIRMACDPPTLLLGPVAVRAGMWCVGAGWGPATPSVLRSCRSVMTAVRLGGLACCYSVETLFCDAVCWPNSHAACAARVRARANASTPVGLCQGGLSCWQPSVRRDVPPPGKNH